MTHDPHRCGCRCVAGAAGRVGGGFERSERLPAEPETCGRSRVRAVSRSSREGLTPPCRHHRWSPPGGATQKHIVQLSGGQRLWTTPKRILLSFFLLFNTKEGILNYVCDWTVDGSHWLQWYRKKYNGSQCYQKLFGCQHSSKYIHIHTGLKQHEGEQMMTNFHPGCAIPLRQRFSIPVLAPPRSAYFACLSLLTHLIQIISLLEVRSMHELCSDWHAPYTVSIAPYTGSIASLHRVHCLPTQGPLLPTQGPLLPTQGPLLPTQCPLLPTQGPLLPTQCPLLPTQGPLLPTQGPLLPTQGPLLPTQGPLLPTQCPLLPTQCPLLPTQCPLLPTQCPLLPTQCPLLPTQCPLLPTQCPLLSTPWAGKSAEVYFISEHSFMDLRCATSSRTDECDIIYLCKYIKFKFTSRTLQCTLNGIYTFASNWNHGGISCDVHFAGHLRSNRTNIWSDKSNIRNMQSGGTGIENHCFKIIEHICCSTGSERNDYLELPCTRQNCRWLHQSKCRDHSAASPPVADANQQIDQL